MIPLTRLIDLLVRFVRTLGGHLGRLPQAAAWMFVLVVLAAGISLVAVGITYIDDLVDAIRRLADAPPPAPGAEPAVPGDTLSPVAPYRLVNIGGGRPAKLETMITELEAALGRPAERILKPLPPGDVPRTNASADLLRALIGAVPETPLSVGVPAFVRWYRAYYAV